MINKKGVEGKSNKRAQVTIFIIIAVVIIALVLLYLVLRGGLVSREIPASIQPAYTSFIGCLQDDVSTGINILESQAGYIELPEFEPGSAHMPFSSQLSIAGNPIPYWYYVSRNGIPSEQVPSKEDMEDELAAFIEDRIRDCDLRAYYDEGFVIELGEPEAETTIRDNEVKVELNMPMTLQKENDTASIRNHNIAYSSKLGKLYNDAKTVFNEEQETLFLEMYGIDSLRLYVPVDGAEITCAPLVWNAEDVFNDLQEAIDANTAALKNKGAEDDYFSLNLPVDEEVRFLSSRNWPNSFEVLPSETQVMIATPVGNQPGFGILGFCYVPYHFVYNIKYPVLIQIGSPDEEIFQFPVAVVIQGNNPRESLDTTATDDLVPELCKYKNTEIQVNTYDTSLNSVDADISYECFGNVCSIGQTDSGTLEENFPQCANGYVIARADGFKDTRYLFSTVQSGSIDVIMDMTYNTNVQLLLDMVPYNGDAMITISSDYAAETLVYPGKRTVNLGEGQHEIQVQIFSDSEIRLGATTKEQCVKVPNGVLGILGLTKDKCFEIQVPEQVVSQSLAGGGQAIQYILETDLAAGKTLEINTASLPTPTTIDEVSNNYIILEQSKLYIEMI